MRFSEILENVNYRSTESFDFAVTNVSSDSRRIGSGSVFVCIKGEKLDGHDFAVSALKSGAGAVVCERDMGLDRQIIVEDSRVAYATLCANYFGSPAKRLKLIAVTGTNGKTTVSTVVKQTLRNMGISCGLIGTVRYEIDETVLPSKYTTPEPWELNALFARMVSAGCEYAVLEASSHALDQQRLYGLEFECGIFTNLTQDHLDYHKTMEKYYEAKRSLFANCKHAVINIDDPYGRRLAKEVGKLAVSCSAQDDNADFTAKNIDYDISGVKYAAVAKGSIERILFKIPGNYSVHNSLEAYCALLCCGFDSLAIGKALSSVGGVVGRCEILYSGKYTVMCDYAHTADALEKFLGSIKPFIKGRLVVLFGCAGERDSGKRPKMGEAVQKYADYIVLTSDNPRTEDPLKIISDVLPVLEAGKVPYEIEPDRLDAIRSAMKQLKEGDVLALCGKGHEDYQVIDGCTIYLDEHRIVKDILIRERG